MVKTARGQECVAVLCLHTLASQEASLRLPRAALWSVQRDAGTLSSDPSPAELQFTELVRNTEYCNPTKLIRKVIYQHNILLFKMTKVTHALHGYLIPDADFAKYLIIDQEY